MTESRLRIVDDDITRLPVDAIVNAANEMLLPGGGVCGAIHRAAGPELAAACARVGHCPTGDARITPGFALAAKWVIHAVGPVWQGGGAGEAGKLAGCYRRSLALAKEHGIRRIAFPAISCGIFGYPLDSAARIAVTECRAALAVDPELEILLVAFDPEVRRALEKALDER